MAVLTDYQYSILSDLAYEDIPGHYLNGVPAMTAQELCRKLIEDGKASGGSPEFRSSVESIAYSTSPEYADLQSLVFKGGVDKTSTTGFTAIAFGLPDGGGTIAAFRGSDAQAIDWADNFGAGITGYSVQYNDVKSFMATFAGEGDVYVTGHSKGGHNAMYAAATSPNVVGGAAFDAQGFPPSRRVLNSQETARLQNSGLVNYVAESDTVGAILDHPEKRVFVKTKEDRSPFDIVYNHTLDSLLFNEDGSAARGSRSLYSVIAQQITLMAVIKIPFWMKVTLTSMGISVEAFLRILGLSEGSVTTQRAEITGSPRRIGGDGEAGTYDGLMQVDSQALARYASLMRDAQNQLQDVSRALSSIAAGCDQSIASYKVSGSRTVLDAIRDCQRRIGVCEQEASGLSQALRESGDMYDAQERELCELFGSLVSARPPHE